MPSSKGVAIKNCPSLLDFKARTGSPCLSLISKITLGRILPFSSKVMPAIKLGFSGDWGNTRSLAKVAAIAGVVLTGTGSGFNTILGLTTAVGFVCALGFAIGLAPACNTCGEALAGKGF